MVNWWRMAGRLVTAGLVMASAWHGWAQATEEPLPLISKMIQVEKKAQKKKKAEEEAYPRTLGVRETRAEATDLLPAGALLYLEMPSGAAMESAFQKTSLSALLNERDTVRFFKENGFSLDTYFSDLPIEYSAQRQVPIARALLTLVQEFMSEQGLVAGALYPRSTGDGFSVLFVADVGGDRKASHERLLKRVHELRQKSPELLHQKADHRDDYIESLRISRDEKGPEAAYGFVRNYLVLSNDHGLARRLLQRAKAGRYENSLAESELVRNLGAKTAPQSQLRGFIDLVALLRLGSQLNMPRSGEMFEMSRNLIGKAAIYYDLQADRQGLRENLTIPTLGMGGDKGTLLGRFRAVSLSEKEMNLQALHTPKLMPYNPDVFIALQVRPSDYAALLMESDTALTAPFDRVLPALKTVFAALGGRIDSLVESEIGVISDSVLREGAEPNWLLAIPLRDTAGTVEALAAHGKEQMTKISGVEVYTALGKIDEVNPAWAVFAQTETTFRNLGYSFLVLASSGRMMEQTIDAAIGGRAVLATNRDFQKQMKRISGKYVAMGYDNILKTVQNRYFQLPALFRSVYPRQGTLHALPQLSTLTKHLFGQVSALAFTEEQELRMTTWSPIGVTPTSLVQLVFLAPQMVRVKEDWQLMEARKKLAELNLTLQEYATQHGHFPTAIHGEVGRQNLGPLLPPNMTLNALLSNPAAAEEYDTEEETALKSYSYVAGLLPSDVPETVILYSSQPFHYHYSDEARKTYEACRLVLTLDGKISAVPEVDFKRKVLPTIRHKP